MQMQMHDCNALEAIWTTQNFPLQSLSQVLLGILLRSPSDIASYPAVGIRVEHLLTPMDIRRDYPDSDGLQSGTAAKTQS